MDSLTELTSRGRPWLRVMLGTRLMLGSYCAAGVRASFRLLARIYCICVAYASTIMLLDYAVEKNTPVFLPLIIEYNTNVIMSVLSEEYYVFNFLKGFQLIDRETGNELTLITPAVRYLFLGICGEKAMFWLGVAVSKKVVNRGDIATFIMVTKICLNCLVIVLPIDLLRCRLRLLRQSLEINFCPLNINNINNRIEILQNTLKLYKRLLDIFFGSLYWAKPRICMNIVFCFVAFMTTGYTVVRSYNFKDASQQGLGAQNVLSMPIYALDFFLSILIIPCLPALFSELVLCECEKLKQIIANLQIICEDEMLNNELGMVASYLEQRSFSFTIFRVLKLDAQLLISFVSFSVTYLFVVIQISSML